jgi:hypothetical protein
MVNWQNERGSLMLDLTLALSILATAFIPLAFSFAREQRLCRGYYHRAVAMEIVDGEMAVLVAGEWKEFSQGEQDYPVRAEAARNLPAGRFVLTVDGKRLRLEWRGAKTLPGGPVRREAVAR